MSLFEFVFGRRSSNGKRRPIETIATPPANADWRNVKPRRLGSVEAELATEDGSIDGGHGELKYEAGNHYLVTSNDGGVSVVRRDIFEQTYRKRLLGGFEKRPDVTYRYFTLDYPAIVETPEGPQRAEAGDWIMQGVVGELWPISADQAERKYAPA